MKDRPLWLKSLSSHGACLEAMKWAVSGKFATWQACWDACERRDWMVWALCMTAAIYGPCPGCIVPTEEDADGVRRMFPRAPRLPAPLPPIAACSNCHVPVERGTSHVPQACATCRIVADPECDA